MAGIEGRTGKMVASGESDTSLLMVTDIMTEVTELLWAGKNGDVLEKPSATLKLTVTSICPASCPVRNRLFRL